MNKLTIPAILVATVMVAGVFAFMPVEQASTVHTTVIASISASCDAATTTVAAGGAETFDIDSTNGGAFIIDSIQVSTAGIDDAADGADFAFTWDSILTSGDIEAAGAADVNVDLLAFTGIGRGASTDGTAETLTVTETHSGTDFTYTTTVCGSTADGGTIDIEET